MFYIIFMLPDMLFIIQICSLSFTTDSIDLFKSSTPMRAEIGYYSDSLFGVIGVVEKAIWLRFLLPERLLLILEMWRRYNIKILRMPDEIIFRTLPVYAYLATNSTHYKNAKKLISTFQSTFF